MENKNPVNVAGGSVGWGGLVDTNGDKIIPANASSDCLNVFEDNGVLYKRSGYTAYDGQFVLGGEYTPTTTGSQSTFNSAPRVSQEIYLTGTGSGADIDFTGSLCDVVIGINIKRESGSYPGTNCTLGFYTVDGSGHPDTVISEIASVNLATLSLTEEWFYFSMSSVTLASAHVCLVLAQIFPSAATRTAWCYSNGSGGYAPGGARVAAYYNGAGWVDVAGVDFKFRFFYRIKTQNTKNVFQYLENSNSAYNAVSTFTNNSAYVSSYTSGIPDSSYYTIFPEGDLTGIQITGYNSATLISTFNVFPTYTGTSGSKNISVSKTRLVSGSENYLFQSSFNSWPLRIDKFTTANNRYAFVNTPYGMFVYPDKNTPRVWGSTTYPLTGYAGAAVFTGLTNPITQANCAMWHKAKMFVGNVTINGVAYPNRIYRSGVNTPEAGYGDTDFLTLDGPVMAMIDCGDYAILASNQNTYLLLNGSLAATSIEQIKHDIGGGISSYEGIFLYKGQDASLKVYGISERGIFEIDRYVKTFIHEKIKNKVSNWIFAQSFICPDYQRDSIIIGFKELTTRKILTYNVISKTWYMENTDVDGMVSMTVGNSAIPVIYGFKGSKIMRMYTGYSDDGTFITAYYKTGPLYINDTKFKPRNIFVKYKNESITSHLDIKRSNDYGTDTTKTIQNGNTSVTSNVPFLKKVDGGGEASAVEITLYQNKITTTVNATSASGAPTLYVASITGFIVGHKIIINDGGAREEVAVISAITATYLTLVSNLTYSHTLAQADAVDTYDESFAVASVDLEVYGSNKVPQDL